MIADVLFFEEDVLRIVCGCAPQSGRYLLEKLSFYEDVNTSVILHIAFDLVVVVSAPHQSLL